MSRPRIVLLGLGGLGCPAALALFEESRARGMQIQLVIVDGDRVDRSNLARQTLYADGDIGLYKTDAAKASLQRLFPGAPVEMISRSLRFDEATAASLLDGADLLLDGTDSFETRFLANDRALAGLIPLVHGAALGWTGQLLSILPGGPCLRCLFEEPPPPGSIPACAEAGVLGPLCAVVGAAMAAEAMAILAGETLHARGALIRWDALAGRARRIHVPRDPSCPACSRIRVESP